LVPLLGPSAHGALMRAAAAASGRGDRDVAAAAGVSTSFLKSAVGDAADNPLPLPAGMQHSDRSRSPVRPASDGEPVKSAVGDRGEPAGGRNDPRVIAALMRGKRLVVSRPNYLGAGVVDCTCPVLAATHGWIPGWDAELLLRGRLRSLELTDLPNWVRKFRPFPGEPYYIGVCVDPVRAGPCRRTAMGGDPIRTFTMGWRSCFAGRPRGRCLQRSGSWTGCGEIR